MLYLQVDLIRDRISKAIVLFAIPILISNVFQQFYNTMDTMIVGDVLGDTSLVVIGACGAVYELLIGFALTVGILIISRGGLYPLLITKWEHLHLY